MLEHAPRPLLPPTTVHGDQSWNAGAASRQVEVALQVDAVMRCVSQRGLHRNGVGHGSVYSGCDMRGAAIMPIEPAASSSREGEGGPERGKIVVGIPAWLQRLAPLSRVTVFPQGEKVHAHGHRGMHSETATQFRSPPIGRIDPGARVASESWAGLWIASPCAALGIQLGIDALPLPRQHLDQRDNADRRECDSDHR